MMEGLTASLSMPTARGGSKVVASERKPAAERRQRQRQYQRLRPQIDALYDELHQQYPRPFSETPRRFIRSKSALTMTFGNASRLPIACSIIA